MSRYSELADRLPCTTQIAIAGTRPCGRCDCCLAADTLRELEQEVERLRVLIKDAVEWADRHGKEPWWLEAFRAALEGE